MGQFISGVATRIFVVVAAHRRRRAPCRHPRRLVGAPRLPARGDLSVGRLRAARRHPRALRDLRHRLRRHDGRARRCAVWRPTSAGSSCFRLVQGVGAAMIASATRVLAMEAMPEGAEGRANGFMTMSFHGGLLLGPPLGGFVIDWLSWRWIFFLLVPIGLAGTVLTVLRARGRRPAPVERPPAVDYVGAILLVDAHTLADADAGPAQRGGAGRRTREHRDRGLRRRSRRLPRARAPRRQSRGQPRPVPESDVRLQRPEPARLRHHDQHRSAS